MAELTNETMEEIKTSIDNIVAKNDEIKSAITTLYGRVFEIKNTLDDSNTDLNEHFNTLLTNLKDHFDISDETLSDISDTLIQCKDTLQPGIEKTNSVLSDINSTLSSFNTTLEGQTQSVGDLSTSLEPLKNLDDIPAISKYIGYILEEFTTSNKQDKELLEPLKKLDDISTLIQYIKDEMINSNKETKELLESFKKYVEDKLDRFDARNYGYIEVLKAAINDIVTNRTTEKINSIQICTKEGKVINFFNRSFNSIYIRNSTLFIKGPSVDSDNENEMIKTRTKTFIIPLASISAVEIDGHESVVDKICTL